MTPRAQSVVRRLGLCVVILVVLARSVPQFYWSDVQFQADEAVIGLMAKHLAEGRAFPVFQYALPYVLVLQAWLSAPFVAIADGSVALVKIAPVALNVATASLLYLIVTSTAGLGPVLGLLVAAPVALPGATTARDLTEALGMNIEALLFALLLWLWRERPILLGITAAVAVKNREFALYAVTALLLVDVLRDRSATFWRRRLVTLVAFALTWSAVEMLRLHSSAIGPGTSVAMLGGGDNMAVAANAMCIVPSMMPRDLWVTATELLPYQFGITMDPRSTARAYGVWPFQAPWLWAPVVAVLAFGVVRGLARARRDGPTSMTWFGLYLVLVGSQAVVVYALTRCGHTSPYTLRYTLLSLLIPAGALALGLERESRTGIRWLMIGVVSAWIAVCAMDHGTLVYALAKADTRGSYRQLTNYLEGQGIQFIQADYRTGYQVAFLSGERIKAWTPFERVHDYTLAVRANLDRAVEVRRVGEERCDGATVVVEFYVCPPIKSPPLP
jgi:hypothetical protein